MAEYRRPFTIRPVDDGAIILTVGARMTRLSAREVAELTAHLAGPVIDREIARLTGVER